MPELLITGNALVVHEGALCNPSKISDVKEVAEQILVAGRVPEKQLIERIAESKRELAKIKEGMFPSMILLLRLITSRLLCVEPEIEENIFSEISNTLSRGNNVMLKFPLKIF
jgi:hypothetical protein